MLVYKRGFPMFVLCCHCLNVPWLNGKLYNRWQIFSSVLTGLRLITAKSINAFGHGQQDNKSKERFRGSRNIYIAGHLYGRHAINRLLVL